MSELPNKELKLTKPGQIGASQLNSSVGRIMAASRGACAARREVIQDPWPFDQPRNAATVSTTFVVNEGAPVLVAVHYADDHSWAFLDGGPFSVKIAMLVSMALAVDHDPSLLEVADLPPGWVARREAVGSDWIREPSLDA